MFGIGKGLSRRKVMKGALTASAYSAPAILSITTARSVAAATPAPVMGGTVNFRTTNIVTAAGSGFAPNTPYLLVLYDPPNAGFRGLQPILTDGNGRFASDFPSGTGVGSMAAPATINGGNIFVLLADTFGDVISTPTSTSTSIPTPTQGRPPISSTSANTPTSAPTAVRPVPPTAVITQTTGAKSP